MPFRGYFALDGAEIANSSRVLAHLSRSAPVRDDLINGAPGVIAEAPPGSGLLTTGGLPQGPVGLFDSSTLVEDPDYEGLFLYEAGVLPCALTEVLDRLYSIPDSSHEVRPGLYSHPDGARRFSPGMYEIDDMCRTIPFCPCSIEVGYDDSWPGLQAALDDNPYRLDTAPWYSSQIPESAEFGGIWVMDVQGLGPTPIDRPVTEMIGSGGAAGAHRDTSRTVKFDAVLIACTNAGVEFGLSWLACKLRDAATRRGARLSYYTAHPSHTSASAQSLARDVYNVVLTQSPQKTEVAGVGGSARNQQATMYRISWEMQVLNPYSYYPPEQIDVDWDTIEIEPINWVHAPDCGEPESCDTMPVLFSADCTPETIDLVTSKAPVCGGCLPVCEIERHVVQLPTSPSTRRCHETAINIDITNNGLEPLTLQLYWRLCGSNELCDNELHPLQVAGLPAGAVLSLDSITGRYTAMLNGRQRRPVGIVGTPSGAPWTPTVVDRTTCWELVAEAAGGSEFDVQLTIVDREP